MPQLLVGDAFPDLLVDFVDRGPHKLSELLSGTWSLVLFYRDEDCHRCQGATAFRRDHALWFPVGYGLDLGIADVIDIHVNVRRQS